MRSLESLIALIGKNATDLEIQSLISDEDLTLSSEPDLDEGEASRSYLSSRPNGYLLELRGGRLLTLFVFTIPTDGYQAFRGPLITGISAGSKRQDIRRVLGSPEKSGEAKAIPILGRKGAWDRYAHDGLYLHFEFTDPDEHLRQITVMDASIAP